MTYSWLEPDAPKEWRREPWLLSYEEKRARMIERWSLMADPEDNRDCPDCSGMGAYFMGKGKVCETCFGSCLVPADVATQFETNTTTVYKAVRVQGGYRRDGQFFSAVGNRLAIEYFEDEWTFGEYPLFAFTSVEVAQDWLQQSWSNDDWMAIWECDAYMVRPAPEYVVGLPWDIIHLGLPDFWKAVREGGSYSVRQPTPKNSVICDRVMLRREMVGPDELYAMFSSDEEEGD